MLMFIFHSQIAVLDTLAQLGCDPSVKDSVSSTPMHVAAGEGHIEAILKLVALVSNAVLALFTQVHHMQKQTACVVCQSQLDVVNSMHSAMQCCRQNASLPHAQQSRAMLCHACRSLHNDNVVRLHVSHS